MGLTLFGGEVSILLSNVLIRTGVGVEDLHIACEVPVAIHLCKLIEMLVCDRRHIELVVSNCQQIVIYVFEDWIADQTIRTGSIRKASSIVQILDV